MKPKNLIIVLAITEQGLTPVEAASRFSVSRQWVHTILTRYQTVKIEVVALAAAD